MPKRLLPFIPARLVVEDVRADPEAVIVTRPRAESAACPVCRQGLDRRHFRYTRTLADLPWQGRRVRITVRARRWRCQGTRPYRNVPNRASHLKGVPI